MYSVFFVVFVLLSIFGLLFSAERIQHPTDSNRCFRFQKIRTMKCAMSKAFSRKSRVKKWKTKKRNKTKRKNVNQKEKVSFLETTKTKWGRVPLPQKEKQKKWRKRWRWRIRIRGRKGGGRWEGGEGGVRHGDNTSWVQLGHELQFWKWSDHSTQLPAVRVSQGDLYR